MKNFTLYLIVTLFTVSLSRGEEKTKKPKADSTQKKIVSLKKKTEKMETFPGLFTFYQDTLSGSLYMEIHKNQINKEYIYFGHAHDGIVDVGFNRGSYRSSKVFSIQKYFNRIEFITENYGFYFNPNSPLNRASGANISKSIMSSNKIIAEDSLKNRLLIKADDLFLSEKLLQIKHHTPPNSKR